MHSVLLTASRGAYGIPIYYDSHWWRQV